MSWEWITEGGRGKLRKKSNFFNFVELEGYAAEDCFNFDESALFYRMQPDRTLATGSIAGSKKSKERITIGLCCNATGTEALKPMVIGQRKTPRCFKNFQPSLLVDYYYSSKGWMNTAIFQEFLQKLNRRMALQKRKIALIVDNHSSHKSPPLSHVKLIHLL